MLLHFSLVLPAGDRQNCPMPRQSRIGDAGAIRHLLDLGDRKMGSFLIQTRSGNASNNLLREEKNKRTRPMAGQENGAPFTNIKNRQLP